MNQDAEDLDDGVKKLIGKTISHVWVDMNDGELEFHLSTNNVLHIWHHAAVFYAFVCPTGSLQHFDALTRHDSA